ncbi:putative phiE125 gp8 family phage protein [Ancylobacter vacuolatus]|uniref:PhiE125 gp8 family phage protein n=2 Tax=Ancylobacter vacuolatus TaxID=223389 RepID=A0ABU0DMS7_9HYPH|nr:putative phiE125 gp8 family phage protein [Ancylobacter vacuolatus]
MLPRVVEAPDPLVTLVEAKLYLRVDSTLEDDLINAFLASASAFFDGPRSIGRAIGAQTLEFDLPCFPCGGIDIPAPTFTSLVSIAYVDAEGAEQTIDAADVRFADGRRVDGQLLPASPWPLDAAPDTIRIRYVAGCPEGEPFLAIAKQGVRLLTKYWYDDREAFGQYPAAAHDLRKLIRVRRF